eukprot:2788060-Rhodomonas_salina.1
MSGTDISQMCGTGHRAMTIYTGRGRSVQDATLTLLIARYLSLYIEVAEKIDRRRATDLDYAIYRYIQVAEKIGQMHGLNIGKRGPSAFGRSKPYTLHPEPESPKSNTRKRIPGTNCTESRIVLSAYYAMPGTSIAYRAICLRADYAMSGTGIAYRAICVRGSEIAYRAGRIRTE